MFRWEIAVATACSAIGVHPFNQPDVELAKQLARKVMTAAAAPAQAGAEASPRPFAPASTPREAAHELASLAAAPGPGRACHPGRYVCLQAYVAPRPEVSDLLQAICCDVRARTGLAAGFGYGPRFLHSTGQLHKGGPATGLFVQLVDAARPDKPVPEAPYSFGDLIGAQALGDRQALAGLGRTVIAADLGGDTPGGLRIFREHLASAW